MISTIMRKRAIYHADPEGNCRRYTTLSAREPISSSAKSILSNRAGVRTYVSFASQTFVMSMTASSLALKYCGEILCQSQCGNSRSHSAPCDVTRFRSTCNTSVTMTAPIDNSATLVKRQINIRYRLLAFTTSRYVVAPFGR